MDRKYIMTSLGYALVGMLLGLYMAGSKNHGQLVTHAHIMLAGSVISFMYALCHKLWLAGIQSRLIMPQFVLHQIGVAVLSVGLFLYYGNFVKMETIDPVLALSSTAIFVGMVLMKIMFIKHTRKAA